MTKLALIKEIRNRNLNEDAPTNSAGGGGVAGIGVGVNKEPGVTRKRKDVIMGTVKRKKVITVNPMPSIGVGT